MGKIKISLISRTLVAAIFLYVIYAKRDPLLEVNFFLLLACVYFIGLSIWNDNRKK